MASQSLRSTSANQALTIDDLAQLENALHGVAHKATAFGLQLGVIHSNIQTIQIQYANPNDQLREILVYRLKQLPPLTWPDIIRALQTNSVQENRLASEIESQFLSASTSSPMQVHVLASHYFANIRARTFIEKRKAQIPLRN